MTLLARNAGIRSIGDCTIELISKELDDLRTNHVVDLSVSGVTRLLSLLNTKASLLRKKQKIYSMETIVVKLWCVDDFLRAPIWFL